MRLVLLFVFVSTAVAQTPESQVMFDVASVKHGRPGDYSVRVNGGPGTGDPTRYTAENFQLSTLLNIAYGIASYQISGPSWLYDERFTITAKVPEGATKEQFRLMMRNLLIERFKLAAHSEKKELAGYELAVAKGGPKLALSPGPPKKDEESAKASAAFKVTLDKEGYPELPPGRQYAMSSVNDRFRCRFADESMEQFVELIASYIHQPIVNATGLSEKYDFVISWSSAATQANAPADSGPSILVAIQEQLGLKLESKRMPFDVIVIDHIERTPSEN